MADKGKEAVKEQENLLRKVYLDKSMEEDENPNLIKTAPLVFRKPFQNEKFVANYSDLKLAKEAVECLKGLCTDLEIRWIANVCPKSCEEALEFLAPLKDKRELIERLLDEVVLPTLSKLKVEHDENETVIQKENLLRKAYLDKSMEEDENPNLIKTAPLVFSKPFQNEKFVANYSDLKLAKEAVECLKGLCTELEIRWVANVCPKSSEEALEFLAPLRDKRELIERLLDEVVLPTLLKLKVERE